MKIVIASSGDPKSMKTWSGIPAHIVYFLEKKGHEVMGVNLNKPKQPWYYDWLRRLHFRLNNKWFLAEVEERYLTSIGNQLDNEIAFLDPDVVLVVHGDFLAYTTFNKPACIIHDATFATLLNYYPSFSKLTHRSVTAGHKMYKKALDRADAAVFSSGWASKSAINDYGAAVSKVFTIPLGANLIDVPDHDIVNDWIETRSQSEFCNLLFFGADWERKGGPDALKVVFELNKLGVKSTLCILGSDPEIPQEMENFVKKIGFLKKEIPAEADQIKALLKEAHVMILPSTAECYGCVYCEANAYGLPVLARDTGGVSEIIKEGVNGFLINENETAEALASKWLSVWNNRENYVSVSLQALSEFEERLNYEVFTVKLETVLNNIVNKPKVYL